MSSVKFDNQEIVTTTYIPRYAKHESTPLRELALLGLAKNDGAILISEKYGTKIIMIAGNIKASTASSMETAIDTFKELFSRKEKNLDISWAGSTRRYVATCTRHEFDRDYMNINFCPWIAEFVVPTGIGKDTSLTAVLDAVSVSTTPYSSSVTFSGSAEPKPIITITIGAGFAATCLGISFENTDTDEKIVVNRSDGFANTKVLEIDCDARTVKYDGEDVSFHGVFPSFTIGTSNFSIETGQILDQGFGVAAYDGQNTPQSTVYVAQSFIVPEKDETYKAIAFYGKRVSNVSTGNLVFEVQTDSGGKPSGTPVTNASETVAEATVTTSDAWQIIPFTTAFTLSGNTKYWLVIKAPNTDGGSYLNWRYRSGVNATYKRGNGAVTTDGGTNWTDYPTRDFLFRIYYGGTLDTSPTLTLDIDYYKKYL